jgi:hypothetical protein
VEVNNWWTNKEEEAERVIEVYHSHGTMEQYHCEVKRDMGVEGCHPGRWGRMK